MSDGITNPTNLWLCQEASGSLADSIGAPDHAAMARSLSEYDCRRCEQAASDLLARRFIICATCGNKRCPKATDHTLECSGSNESGQPGSDYK